jgi:hypothetical protein
MTIGCVGSRQALILRDEVENGENAEELAKLGWSCFFSLIAGFGLCAFYSASLFLSIICIVSIQIAQL